MVVLNVESENAKVVLSKTEREEMKEQLDKLQEAGARYIVVNASNSLENYMYAYDDKKQKVGAIVGNLANIISFVQVKINGLPFFGVPVSIEAIKNECLK